MERKYQGAIVPQLEVGTFAPGNVLGSETSDPHEEEDDIDNKYCAIFADFLSTTHNIL